MKRKKTSMILLTYKIRSNLLLLANVCPIWADVWSAEDPRLGVGAVQPQPQGSGVARHGRQKCRRQSAEYSNPSATAAAADSPSWIVSKRQRGQANAHRQWCRVQEGRFQQNFKMSETCCKLIILKNNKNTLYQIEFSMKMIKETKKTWFLKNFEENLFD